MEIRKPSGPAPGELYKDHCAFILCSGKLPPVIYQTYYAHPESIFCNLVIPPYGEIKALTKNWEWFSANYNWFDPERHESFVKAPMSVLENYAEGFLKGVKHSFVPFIDTPENRKELVMMEIIKPPLWFSPSDVSGVKSNKFDEGLFMTGEMIGKLYKAWEIVLENPRFFEEDFNKHFPKQEKDSRKDETHVPTPERRLFDSHNLEQMKNTADRYLSFLSGYNLRGEQIMPEDDFRRLTDYTYHLIEHNSVPNNLKAITRIELHQNWIRYTYYKIHNDLFTTRPVRDSFIHFLMQVFPSEFGNWDQINLKKKFSTPVKGYEEAVKKMQR